MPSIGEMNRPGAKLGVHEPEASGDYEAAVSVFELAGWRGRRAPAPHNSAPPQGLLPFSDKRHAALAYVAETDQREAGCGTKSKRRRRLRSAGALQRVVGRNPCPEPPPPPRPPAATDPRLKRDKRRSGRDIIALTRNESADRWIAAIREVLRGHRCFSQRIPSRLE
jgi:hypothetical protein